jgi:hypothetical protein
MIIKQAIAITEKQSKPAWSKKATGQSKKKRPM